MTNDHPNPATINQEAVITLRLPPHEADAFALFINRTGYGECARVSNRIRTCPDGRRSETDVMWCAVQMVKRQLEEAGLQPR